MAQRLQLWRDSGKIRLVSVLKHDQKREKVVPSCLSWDFPPRPADRSSLLNTVLRLV